MQISQNQYVVHKFGGSSVANAERIAALPSLLSGKNEVIVVSAMHGVTNTLDRILKAAKAGQPSENLNDLVDSHMEAAQHLIKNPDVLSLLEKEIQNDISEIQDILHAVRLISSYTPDIEDRILGYGEIWSSKILSHYLQQFHRVLYLDAAAILFIFEKNGMIAIDWIRTQMRLEELLKHKSFDQIVIPGFIASTLDGKRTTLGRNGSDFSAAIFAKLFKAKSLTIWTDVDGIFTADPNRVPSAFVIDSLSYHEAMELAYFGAKVLHPMTIAPAEELNIPIIIKNSFNPDAKGTLIEAASAPSSFAIKGLTAIDNIALFNVEGAGMAGISGIASRLFQVLHQHNISVILIAQASSEHSICFAIPKVHAEMAKQALQENFKFEMENRQIQRISMNEACAILSVVGDGMIGKKGVSGQLALSLANANVNINAISQGSSERNISVVIENHDVNRALRAVHAGFYLSRETISIGIIGPGQVGGALLSQIQQSLQKLKSSSEANLLVRGIMNSRKMLLAQHSIDLSDWREQLQASDIKASIDEFVDHLLRADIPHAVIIDCTANQNIAKHYLEFIKKGIHVITPNKHANAGDLDYYKKLKSLTANRQHYYLYEATVCAGLPVINTLQDLIKTGDRVEKIEGIVSGTLSYIFNELAKNRKFSDIVLEAKKRGFTEPDPREDLSGRDVARKLVCLAREIGLDKTIEEVDVFNLVPEALRSCSVDEFLQKLPEYDNAMEKLLAKAHANQEKMAYVGTINNDGSMQVTMQAFSAGHPFSRMQGTDNMLIFHTQRYHDQPLVIQGPGAGAEVTAAGIFADLLRLVSFLSGGSH